MIQRINKRIGGWSDDNAIGEQQRTSDDHIASPGMIDKGGGTVKRGEERKRSDQRNPQRINQMKKKERKEGREEEEKDAR